MKKLLFYFLYILPKNYVSQLVGRFVHMEQPRQFAQWLKHYLIKRFQINTQEAEYDPDFYPSFGKYFIRKLKPEARPIQGELVHPADAKLTQICDCQNDTLIQAKGKAYSMSEMLGGSKWLETFKNAKALTYYLCPTDYHRVHSPVNGEILETTYLPGKLWPVNDWSVNTIRNLFAINERTVSIIKTPKGYVAMVMIGATNVGKITLSYDSSIITNTERKEPVTIQYQEPITIRAGEEFGIFHMGSTVVALFEPRVLE